MSTLDQAPDEDLVYPSSVVQSVGGVARFLNELLEIDRENMTDLFLNEVPATDGMLEHPTVQCGPSMALADQLMLGEAPDLEDESYVVRFIGVLNGIFGADPATGYGHLQFSLDWDEDQGRWLVEEFSVVDHDKKAGVHGEFPYTTEEEQRMTEIRGEFFGEGELD